MSTIEQMMREWQRRRGPVMTARTRATNVAPVNVICELIGNCKVERLTLVRVESLRNVLLERGMSKITVARYLSTLRAGLGDAGEHLKIGKLISELKREPTKVECWTKEEVQKILDFCNGGNSCSWQFYLFVSFLFNTGCRRGEALALWGDDIDMDKGRLHLHRSLSLDGDVQNGTKWGGERWVPISDKLRILFLDTKYHAFDRVFCELDQRTVGRQFNRIRDAAGVRPFKLHCTRHTAISWALAAGMSLRKASEIFGVSQGTLESHYAHYVEEEVPMDWAEL